MPASTNAVWFNTSTPTITDPALPSAPVPGTTVADIGTKIYGVKLVSTIGCGESPLTPVSVTVNSKPQANLSILGEATTDIKVCQIASSPIVNFSATGGQQPYTITYRLNGGGNNSQLLPNGTSNLTVPVPTNNAMTYEFQLVGIKDVNGCESTLSANAKINVLPIPSATVSAVSDVCQGAPGAALTFNGTGGTAPYNFIYELNNSGTDVTVSSTGNAYTITPSSVSPGVFQYHLKGIEYAAAPACRQNISIIKTITVHAPPAPPAIPMPNVAFCEGISGAALPAVVASSGHTLRWYGTNPTGGTATLAPPTPDVSTARTINYYVSQSENVLGCESNRSIIPVTINPLPNASVSIVGITDPLPRFCQSSPEPQLLFTASTGTAPYTFAYTSQLGSAAPTSASVDPSVTNTLNIPTNVPGIRTFRPVEIRDANGCLRNLSGSAPLTVEILATPDASITSATTTVCQNAATPAIVFTGSKGTPSYVFEYDINGSAQTPATSGGAQTATLYVPTATVKTFNYTLRSVAYTVGSTTCSKPLSATASITVNPLPVASLTATATNVLVCKDDARPQFIINGTSGAAPYTFEYTRNGTAMTASGASHLERVSTNIVENIQYRLTGISDANGCRQTATGNFDVEVAPIPVVNAGSPVWILSGQDALLNATASNANGMTYQWTPPMFVDNPSKLQPLARPLSTTTFTLTAISDKGCSNNSSVVVTVLFQPEIPNTFTPNGDGANDRWEIKNLESYPNAVVEVYNTAGQVVYKSTGFYTPWDGTRNGTKLPVGTYYYVIHTRFNNVKKTGFITLLR